MSQKQMSNLMAYAKSTTTPRMLFIKANGYDFLLKRIFRNRYARDIITEIKLLNIKVSSGL